MDGRNLGSAGTDLFLDGTLDDDRPRLENSLSQLRIHVAVLDLLERKSRYGLWDGR